MFICSKTFSQKKKCLRCPSLKMPHFYQAYERRPSLKWNISIFMQSWQLLILGITNNFGHLIQKKRATICISAFTNGNWICVKCIKFPQSFLLKCPKNFNSFWFVNIRFLVVSIFIKSPSLIKNCVHDILSNLW